jgi:hypothetical protein
LPKLMPMSCAAVIPICRQTGRLGGRVPSTSEVSAIRSRRIYARPMSSSKATGTITASRTDASDTTTTPSWNAYDDQAIPRAHTSRASNSANRSATPCTDPEPRHQHVTDRIHTCRSALMSSIRADRAGCRWSRR